ncbi:MAG TPA: sigma-70 family RNA polymerase sigma factor [Saprospiraceae bacterium]|nr:sigma-70 family RNA polymerase sigma factor [Saprospiraceae bacterium]MBK7699756.1 sigma-70 family RNA polymerase sigma factor [Saprospiraceae bacterium]MBK8828096.1 sigma-70 family RNA polymerase sigma factor [Saprospiraceae bacterium]MBK8886282.1 sigma-70 family RNA polymerase sigma factor [Saprospiraceae bacterium]MBK9581371.1 sigma-70 family RNA polymerase sigma factor [Saprospiraceae bacterium]
MNNDKMNALELPFKDKLYRFALNIVGNTFDAEDIMQELMIKIWNRMDQYTLIENKEAWCMTVTRNMCIDKVRNKKTSAQDISDYHHLRDSTPTVDKKLEETERFGNIMSLVNQLPEKQKMIIHLRDVEGYTYQEIADLTETTVDFVKVSLHRARKALKEALLKRNIKRYEA